LGPGDTKQNACPISAALKRAFLQEAEPELLQLHFLVVHMLASFGIKFLDQHLLGHGFLFLLVV
jgi:hypothetical protein